MALLTIEQQQTIKPIPHNWAQETKYAGGMTNYERVESEVEELDIRKLLGDALLDNVQAEPNQSYNKILLDGGQFFDCDNNKINFKGLRYVLAYFTYKAYIGEAGMAETALGAVFQKRNETERASSGEIKRAQQRADEIAMRQWELCRTFLNNNAKFFPLWNCTKTSKPGFAKFYGIKKSGRNRTLPNTTGSCSTSSQAKGDYDDSYDNSYS